MFFFFVGGVGQQVRQVVKSNAGRCINCNSTAVDLVEYDKVLKLFFVPVWKWPGKDTMLHCNDCHLFFPRDFSLPPPQRSDYGVVSESLKCGFCDRVVEPQFKFCPYCGTSL